MLVISNYSNFLSISLKVNSGTPKEQIIEKNISLDTQVLNKSEILNTEEYARILKENLIELKINYKQLPCVFLLDPTKINLRFIKNSKDGDEQQLLNDTLTELGISEEDSYFSCQKRTPLFGQFVSIDKKSFDSVLEVSSKLGLKVIGVFSYLTLLSRFREVSDNSAFISSYLGNMVLVLTRYGGVFFNKTYGSFSNPENSGRLMKIVSEHRESGNIEEIYSFNFETPEVSQSLGLKEITFSNLDKFQNPIHALAHQVLESENGDIFASNFNLINLIIPEPVNEKSNIWIKVVISTLVLFLTLGVGGYYYFYPNEISQVLSSFTSNTSEKETSVAEEVIKEFDITKQNSNSLENTAKNEEKENQGVQINEENIDLDAPMTTKDLDKSKFRLQVLNATTTPGIAGRNAEFLRTSLGYKQVSTGNSAEKVEGTLVRIKKSYEKYQSAFSKEFLNLKNVKFEVVEDSKQNFDMVIILGK